MTFSFNTLAPWLLAGLAVAARIALSSRSEPDPQTLELPPMNLPLDQKAHVHLLQFKGTTPFTPFVGTTEWSASPPLVNIVEDTLPGGAVDQANAFVSANGTTTGDTTITAKTTLPSGAVLTITTTVTITPAAPAEPDSMQIVVDPPVPK